VSSKRAASERGASKRFLLQRGSELSEGTIANWIFDVEIEKLSAEFFILVHVEKTNIKPVFPVSTNGACESSNFRKNISIFFFHITFFASTTMKKSAKREGRVNFSPTSIFFSYYGFLFSDVLNQVAVSFFFSPHAPACRRSFQCR
jgi:hypothetical protein